MQDNDGNTALHLAVKAVNLTLFSALLGNKLVHLNLTNEKGKTPLDIARHNVEEKGGLNYNQVIYIKVHSCKHGLRCKRDN
jgi:hypothetical protein